jgi:hypothetical protein
MSNKSTEEAFNEFDEALHNLGHELLDIIEPYLFPILEWLNNRLKKII